MNPSDICTELAHIAQEAGELALHLKQTGTTVLDWREFVTEADKQVDGHICSRLQVRFPGIAIYSEESGDQQHVTHGLMFVVDPIDGTDNYANGFGPWGISIAAVHDGRTIAGVVHDAVLQYTYFAHRDRVGAYLQSAQGELPLIVSKVSNLSQAHAWTDWVKGDYIQTLDILARLRPRSVYPRIAMCATQTLMMVASGKLDAYIHPGPGPEDVAAAAYILEKAGGIVTTLTGEPWSPFGGSVVAANNVELHLQLLALLSSPATT